MRATRNETKEQQRAKLESAVEEFLKNGNEIHEVQREETRWYRDLQDKGSLPHRRFPPPLTIKRPTRSASRHPWGGGLRAL